MNLLKRYLLFFKEQEAIGEPFHDKVGQLNNFYLPIADYINKNVLKKKRTFVIGLAGGQGSGKSTISQILKLILQYKYKLSTVIFSIDDLYKTRKERIFMSKKIHPLFQVRGVPGTHDINLATNILKIIKRKKFKSFHIPTFDKSKDDRNKKKKWQFVKQSPNVVFFEGWCVGARPQNQKKLLKPINNLEKFEDRDCMWRQKVNLELKNKYINVFKKLDKFIFLKVPSFKHVLKWRMLQEQKLKLKKKGSRIMNNKEIKRFVMFYERITKQMLADRFKYADVIIDLDTKHKLSKIKFL